MQRRGGCATAGWAERREPDLLTGGRRAGRADHAGKFGPYQCAGAPIVSACGAAGTGREKRVRAGTGKGLYA
ncbi:hypothetical protein Scani_23220 [Streptomyces caniferus]|uniref:Uncharacterized protein n=1 Tax=Streptomyces caniferus TaxID=285557 RepID=A0A640S5G2_9ACTN|nr:hypothetical protein Scani_23220 [Streptomyces caniferus]